MKKKVALVLGSGGARGTAHIGVIREILSQGYEISSISGTSMGAMVGGIYACGKLDEYEEWICKLDKRSVLNLVDFTLSKNGLMKADKFINELKKFIPDINIEDLPISYSAIATDLINTKEKVFITGSLWDAIRASISIPFFIKPAKIDNISYVDGGVLNPVPINRVKRENGDILIAVDVNSPVPANSIQILEKNEGSLGKQYIKNVRKKLASYTSLLDKNSMGYIHIGSETSSMMLAQITKLTIKLYPPDIMINVSHESCGTFDFHLAEDIILVGKLAAVEGIANYNK